MSEANQAEQLQGRLAQLDRLQKEVRPDDVTIMWGNKATYNRHKVAIEVQDAVNLRALAREFVKVVDSAMEDVKDTGKTWEDAAVRLFVNKFESLCRSEENFSEAYKVCQEKAGHSDSKADVSVGR